MYGATLAPSGDLKFLVLVAQAWSYLQLDIDDWQFLARHRGICFVGHQPTVSHQEEAVIAGCGGQPQALLGSLPAAAQFLDVCAPLGAHGGAGLGVCAAVSDVFCCATEAALQGSNLAAQGAHPATTHLHTL